jgi:arylsulfatase A-like enzyme
MNAIKICFTAFIFTFLIGCTQKTSPPPNIILFLVDDMGWQDTSVPFYQDPTPFNRLYNTPAMERLASEGMKFTQAYASSVCSPTRISLMTGMNAARHRVTNWTLWKNKSQDAPHPELEFPLWNMNGMSPVPGIENTIHATPLPQLLKDAGYFTIHCGKAHLGAISTPAADPLNIGFKINIAGHAAGGPGSYYGSKNFGNKKGEHNLPWGIPGLEKYHGQDIYLNEALTIEAIQALDSARKTGQPFFLYMAHYAIHAPIQEDPRFLPSYLNDSLPLVESRYASMIESMDKSLGDLLDYLDKNDLENQTIILFMSDNGGLSASVRGGIPHTHNRPLSSGKGSAHEGGIREPMIVKWPGVVEAGSKCSEYIIIEDYFPTILEMARISNYQVVQDIDGRSFLSMLKNEVAGSSGRSLFWHYPNNWGPTGPGIGASSTIRKGDWKLIYYYENQSFELFNIKEDIGEYNNLADEWPGKVDSLSTELTVYLKSVDAQRPFLKSIGTPCPWPDQTK